MSDRTSRPVPPPIPSQFTSDGRRTSGNVIILSAPRPSDLAAQDAKTTSAESQPARQETIASTSSDPETSRSGRPLDVHSDVQRTSAASAALATQPPLSVDTSMANDTAGGRQTDVHHAAKDASILERPQHAPRRQRKSKRKTALDERGGYRHTVRLDPKGEKKLRAVAEILGVDLNAAISVCISVHYHRLTKPGGGEG